MDVWNEQGVDRTAQAYLLETARKDFPEAITFLRHSGLLAVDDWKLAARTMRQVAAADLSLARLYEGHVNARLLINTYANPSLREKCLAEMEEGLLFGVWGADGREPVTLEGDQLIGAKRYASGLGLVDRAIVSAKSSEGQQLVIIDAGDTHRHDLTTWNMVGMLASRSGSFDCRGLGAEKLGAADIFTREPHFLGGTWRIAAVTLGGTVGLLERAAAEIRARGHQDAEAHLLRLGPIAGQVASAWCAIMRAGEFASGDEGRAEPDTAAIRSLSVRLLTEEIGQSAIAAVERSIGLAMFDEDHEVGRMARDLACYMRQAARDAFCVKVARALLMDERPLGDWLDA